ncbi:unnamed protein product [Protopolystoma xenopodis]|uniref:Uncharacterized protein n=1 Tax=Protopolystoma xenopodis TaxID=117903 RepID=A0A3S5A7H6_9PLAT|nr:unnamed protein product [Protopolystoma xenopodis]
MPPGPRRLLVKLRPTEGRMSHAAPATKVHKWAFMFERAWPETQCLNFWCSFEPGRLSRVNGALDAVRIRPELYAITGCRQCMTQGLCWVKSLANGVRGRSRRPISEPVRRNAKTVEPQMALSRPSASSAALGPFCVNIFQFSVDQGG